jgi:hypothetical protein
MNAEGASILLCMGELSESLSKYGRIILSRYLARSPWVQGHLWQIGTVIGAILIVEMIRETRKNNPRKVQTPINSVPVSSQIKDQSSLGQPKEMVAASSIVPSKAPLWNDQRRWEIKAPKSLRIPLGISLLMLLFAALGDFPYDFFVLLRVVIFVTCGLAFISIWKSKRTSSWLWVLLLIAVLYNPLLPIHLHRITWIWLNVTALIALGLFRAVLKSEDFTDHVGTTV